MGGIAAPGFLRVLAVRVESTLVDTDVRWRLGSYAVACLAIGWSAEHSGCRNLRLIADDTGGAGVDLDLEADNGGSRDGELSSLRAVGVGAKTNGNRARYAAVLALIVVLVISLRPRVCA